MELHHIFYKGHKYPCRTLLTNDSYYITVSTEDLEKELIDENGLALNNTAMLMDNKIAFYFPSIKDLKRNSNELLKEIYL